MKRIICLFLFLACSLQHAISQSNPPISNAELEARGTWIFWPYKSYNDGSGCTVESTLMFANGNAAARFADSVSYFPMYGSSSSTPAPPCDTFDFCDLVNQDYIKGVLLVFGWNYLQYDTSPTGLGNVPTYGVGGNDLIQYQKFYEAIKAVVNTDNVKGYGIEIWTGNWATIV